MELPLYMRLGPCNQCWVDSRPAARINEGNVRATPKYMVSDRMNAPSPETSLFSKFLAYHQRCKFRGRHACRASQDSPRHGILRSLVCGVHFSNLQVQQKLEAVRAQYFCPHTQKAEQLFPDLPKHLFDKTCGQDGAAGPIMYIYIYR